jgi:3-phosphoshikimate 1-carboxyvinyltransferase
MCAALAGGKSEIFQPLSSDDTEAAIDVLKKIGVRIISGKDIWQVSKGNYYAPHEDLFCRNSAATMRFMSAICALVKGQCRLTAGTSLAKRPVITLVEALKRWDVDISCEGDYAPVIINGGKFKGGLTELPGDISSQYLSALLLIASQGEQAATIRLSTPAGSKPYILMTLECLEQFGIQIKYAENFMEYEASPQTFKPTVYEVEGDWSSASYLAGLGALAGEIKVENLNLQSLQGDRMIIEFLREMGAFIKISADAVVVKKNDLKAISANLNDCIDLLPTVAVLASLAHGTSEFTGVQRARLKESNRISVVCEGLKRAGIKVVEEADKLVITGGKPQNAVIDSHDDHRIAMAFSLMGVTAGGITINGAECIAKTYPEYWSILRNLGVKMDEQ